MIPLWTIYPGACQDWPRKTALSLFDSLLREVLLFVSRVLITVIGRRTADVLTLNVVMEFSF
jgi:hypothetical protein